MALIMDQLAEEHGHLSVLLDILENEVRVLRKWRTARYDITRSILKYMRSYPEMFHHPKEDAIYGRMMRLLPQTKQPIHDLCHEHRELDDLTQQLSDMIEDFEAGKDIAEFLIFDRIDAYIGAYREHIRIENEFFFPMAIRFLTGQEMDDAALSVPRSGEDLFPAEAADAFETLRTEILHTSSRATALQQDTANLSLRE